MPIDDTRRTLEPCSVQRADARWNQAVATGPTVEGPWTSDISSGEDVRVAQPVSPWERRSSVDANVAGREAYPFLPHLAT